MAKKKPNGHISIEKFDDIAFEDEDYSKELSQVKHSVSKKSLDDKSPDVWKTLNIWIDQFEKGIITFNSTKFVLITTAEAKQESAMALLRPGAGTNDRKKCRELLKVAAADSKNDATEQAREAFLQLTDEQALTLLNQIEVIDGFPNLPDVMTEIEGEIVLIAPSHTSQAAESLEGWWLNVVGKCLVEDASSSIPVQNIIRKANDIGLSFGKDSLPVDDPDKLGLKDYSAEDEDKVLVRQMRIVDLPDSMVRRGVQDYYRAFAQRSKWARENLILDSELGKFDDKLKDKWERKFDADLMTTDPSTEPEMKEFGRKMCVWASQQSDSLRNIVEIWITSGSFQGLSDRLLVGWHPNFKKIIKKN